MLGSRLVLTAALSAAMALLSASPAAALSFTLSEFSDNETSPSVLDAMLEFGVAGNLLTLVIENTTQPGDLYDINQIYFTTSDNVTGLTLLTASGSVDGSNLADWSLRTDVGFGAFGTFDFALEGPQMGSSDAQITPNEVQTFTLSIVCAALATCGVLDFGSQLSTHVPGSTSVLVAAKFVGGPGDNSAGGGTATAAEPRSALLLLIATAAAGLCKFGYKDARRRVL